MPARSAYEVAIADSQHVLKLSKALVRKVVRQTLAAERVASATISVAIVDNPTMRELNCRHLNHDYDTDVLSFLLDCDDSGSKACASKSEPRGAGKILDGEIIVSAEMAKQRAGEFQWKPEDELVYYLVHGLLHLAGYDDLTPRELKTMRAREQDVLHVLGLKKSRRSSKSTKH